MIRIPRFWGVRPNFGDTSATGPSSRHFLQTSLRLGRFDIEGHSALVVFHYLSATGQRQTLSAVQRTARRFVGANDFGEHSQITRPVPIPRFSRECARSPQVFHTNLSADLRKVVLRTCRGHVLQMQRETQLQQSEGLSFSLKVLCTSKLGQVRLPSPLPIQ